jgi:hypothetical protein
VPGRPVVSCPGYSLIEPWGAPRVVIGIDAHEAGYLAEFLDRDKCAQRRQASLSRAQLPQARPQHVPIQQVKLAVPAPEGTGE